MGEGISMYMPLGMHMHRSVSKWYSLVCVRNFPQSVMKFYVYRARLNIRYLYIHSGQPVNIHSFLTLF